MGAQFGKSAVEKSPAAAASHHPEGQPSDESPAKASSTGLPPSVKASVANMAGDVLVEELIVPMHEKVTHMKSMIEGETGIHKKQQKLVLGSKVLKDEAFLFDIGIKDGSMLTLLRCRLPILLHVALIDDSVQGSRGVHKLALQSEPLADVVEKIEVTVAHWHHHDWGGKQARWFICLHDPAHDDCSVAERELGGCLRNNEYDFAEDGSSPSTTLGVDKEVVSLAKPGMVYKLGYRLGGGGDHTIKLQFKIFPAGAANEEPWALTPWGLRE